MAIKDGDKLPQVSSSPTVREFNVPPDGGIVGNNATSKLAFHGATPIAQRSGAAQAAVAATTATNVSPYGYTTQAQADALVTLVNEMRQVLVTKGLMKGSA